MKPLKRMIIIPLSLLSTLSWIALLVLCVFAGLALVLPFFLLCTIEFIVSGNFAQRSGDSIGSFLGSIQQVLDWLVSVPERLLAWAERD